MRKIDTRNFQRATRSTPREINRQIVLNLIHEHQPISRAELARRMGVGRGMVTPLVSELLNAGLICEGVTGDAPRGRKPTLLHVRTRDRLAVAIDVRYSRTRVMLSDFSGREVALEEFTTPLEPDRLVAELATRVRRLLAGHARVGACEGVGLVVPGMVHRRTGAILRAPALGWQDVDLRGALAAALGLPVHIERDAVAGALARIWLGRRGGGYADNFVFVTVADGIGTGLVVDGQVVRGSADTAGECGHLPLSLDGPACMCGARGCWEAYASNPATIARYLGRELSTRDAYARIRESGLTVGDVIARAGAGDTAASAALEASARYLGFGLAALINTLNPSRILVSGDITADWERLEPIVSAAVRQRTLTATAGATPIVPERSDGNSRLRGATALVVAPFFAAPRVG